jgi:PKD repeat protein
MSEGQGVVCETFLPEQTDGCAVDLQLGPEGDIYYTDITTGTIHRLSYEGYPVTVLASNTTEAHAGHPIAFIGDRSTSPHLCSTTYRWEFGDGSSSTNADTSHIYATAGTYTVSLTVSDTTEGTHDTSSQQVTVLGPGAEIVRPELHTDPPPYCPPPPAGSPPPAPPAKESPPPSPTPTIALSGVTLKPTSFAPARSQSLRKPTGKGRSAVGATLRLSLSLKGSVRLTFARGVRAGKSVRYQSIAAHGVVSHCTGNGRKRKCRSPKTNRITVGAGAGADSLVLSGWVGGVPLPPGSYSLTVQAIGSNGTTSAPVAVHFTILAPAKH